jgi:hypothetical protein
MAVVTHFTISGTCNINGTTITIGGSGSGTQIVSGGTYSFTAAFVAGNFPLTVTPSLSGFNFSPTVINEPTPVNDTNANFIGNTVAGQVGAFAVGI